MIFDDLILSGPGVVRFLTDMIAFRTLYGELLEWHTRLPSDGDKTSRNGCRRDTLASSDVSYRALLCVSSVARAAPPWRTSSRVAGDGRISVVLELSAFLVQS
ncbi:hypothetical protein RB195_011580 [Necator americanus]|uniref:Uncharacterized protein n=1 Tax=Necator americanus TaxID=51031 RepID=A0ABR1D4T3_NECAM